MAFDPINKVSYNELTPELQELIDSKVNQIDFDSHINNTTMHITQQEREQWNSITNNITEYIEEQFTSIVGTLPSETTNIIELINSKLDITTFTEFKDTLHEVAFSGDYNDLENKPSNISYSDESNYATEAGTASEAEHAAEADHATSADTASNATNADAVNNIEIYVQSSQPTPSKSYALWFDTTNQIMKAYNSGTWLMTKSVW